MLDALETLAELRRRDVGLHLIGLGDDVRSDGMAKLIFPILVAAAGGERSRIRERIRDTKRCQASRVQFLGGHRPFGYAAVGDMDGDRLEPMPEELAANEEMRDMRAAAVSLPSIAETMGLRRCALSYFGVRKLLRAQDTIEATRIAAE